MSVIIVGKQASGKNTLVNHLVESHGFRKVVTYTTRPKRPGEIDGVDYHFISEEEFIKLELNGDDNHGFFTEVEWFRVNTPSGPTYWYYGSRKGDLVDPCDVIILTPKGSLKYGRAKYTTVYLNVSEKQSMMRALERGDRPLEVARRALADAEDFKDIESCYFDVIVIGDYDLEKVARDIAQFIKDK